MQGWAQKRTGNGKDLTEAEEIKKRWQEYTAEYKNWLDRLNNIHTGHKAGCLGLISPELKMLTVEFSRV